MSSDESDDEPLSVLAAEKKRNPDKFEDYIPEEEDSDDGEYFPQKKQPAKKKKKKNKDDIKKLPNITLKICRKENIILPTAAIVRPLDVWMYLKDLKATGPYNCLLCPDWFINKTKMLAHYILNHNKDYCGICRYFVADRETWNEHLLFHTPWPCSQCMEQLPSESGLREHLSVTHKLVHCRVCHFRLPDDEQYKTHLSQKHNIKNLANADFEYPWLLEINDCKKFRCSLCSKTNIQCTTFFNHCIGYHHFTIKCLASIVCGKDVPFRVSGADVSPAFVEKMKGQGRFGYVDWDPKITDNIGDIDMVDSITDIKQEISSEPEDAKDGEENESHDDINTVQVGVQPDEHDVNIIKTYRGEDDFDITLTELVVLQKCYFRYGSQILNDINSNKIPENSIMNYEKIKDDYITLDIDCSLCDTKSLTIQSFITHMNKFHGVKSVPIYSCRVCGTNFDSQSELNAHISDELHDFDDLWICQFCDKEFDNRESTRRHLTEHWDAIEYDNCFSPHLGFKCKYCPTLFWNETDREIHQTKVHFQNHKDNFYQCEVCSEMFSDKVWFVHHYLEKHQTKKEQIFMLKCCLCWMVLKSVEDMRTHFNGKHPEAKKIYCNLDSCRYKPLSHRKSFNLHLKAMHSPSSRLLGARAGSRSVNCRVCAREFMSERACSAHVAQVHNAGKFKCNICKDMMHTMDERKLHYMIRHPGHHPFECRDCGKSFLYKSSLYMHRQEHAAVKPTHTCNYCGKVFAKKDSYREHVQIHEGPRHACSYCPMRFVQRSNMLRHERRHTGERPYACKHCPRTFADKGACTSHSKTHLNNTPFACMYCGQTFIQKSKLTYHIRKHTGENLETCTICSKLFTSACSLREHMKTHSSNDEAVKCPLCERTYKDDRCMLRHLRTTHSGSQFTCPVCGKTLTTPSGLRHHVVTHSHLNTFRCKCCSESAACKRTILRHLRKRHSLKPTEVNIKDFYRILDPRECNLELDEETMTNIFGPPKKPVNIGDIIFAKPLETSGNDKEECSEEENDGESDEDSGDKKDIKVFDIQIKKEEDLEPTDFVTVKIEQMEVEDEESLEWN